MPFYDTLSGQRYIITRTHCANESAKFYYFYQDEKRRVKTQWRECVKCMTIGIDIETRNMHSAVSSREELP